MEYNITYRQKDKGIQAIISYKIDGSWKQKSKQGFQKKADAKKWALNMADELKEEIALNKSLNLEYKELIFKDFIDMYKKHEILYKEYGTVRSTKFAVAKFTSLNDLTMNSITSLHIQSCVDAMVREGLNPSTIRLYVTKLTTIFNTAVQTFKIITSNPVNQIKVPEIKENNKQKALTKLELNNLLGKITYKKYWLTSLIAATCGLRLGEILGLQWNDIDFKGATLKIDKQWKQLSDGNWGFGTVKSNNSNRSVPIPRNTLIALKKYKKEFPTDLNNRVILYSDTVNLSREMKKNYIKAGYDITIHDLRHTYATMLISNGVDFKTAAKLLGHDIEQTMKTYSHVNDDMLDKATNIANSIF